MTPEDFDEAAANLAAGFYLNAETLRQFVAEALRLRDENTQLRARCERLRAVQEREGTAKTVWPGEER